jgi:hypothetical protein
MKIGPALLAALLAGAACLPISRPALAVSGQSIASQAFSGAIPSSAPESDPAASSAPDSGPYAEGTKAINEGRWADAIAIFTRVAAQREQHADGALYWKAYAENKLDQAIHAADTCTALRREYPSSRWLDECRALEIELRALSGRPVQIVPGESDELKLLALNAMMRQDEARAMAQIQEILNGNSSEKLKQGALFILGEHHSNETYAQIVRISYAEGDVRIARGKQAERTTGSAWEKAVTGLPLETGFSLATGEGRAEIEFENASTLYLAENSVLVFNDLHTSAGVPHTELALLSGTVSLDIKPFIAGEWFVLRSPADNLAVTYPHRFSSRVTSYVDALAVTALDPGVVRMAGTAQQPLTKGQTEFYRDGARVADAPQTAPDAFAAWDGWVANRVAERASAMAEVMKASGLSAPIPGMAQMRAQGTFFACAPYGTCWEPSEAADREPGDARLSAAQAFSAGKARKSAQESGAGSAANHLDDLEFDFFPCYPMAFLYRRARDPNTGAAVFADSVIDPMNTPYFWAVCHAGSWVHRNHRYVWVLGHKRHHLEPVRWVKSGHKVAFVPIHPYDVKGRPPINRKEEVFAVSGKDKPVIEPVKFGPEHPIELLKSPPREYRSSAMPPLAKAEEPHLEAHSVKDALAIKNATAKAPGIPLNFDHKSQSFVMARQVTQGGKSVTVATPINNRGGTLQARAGGSGAGGGARGEGGGGSSHGGSSHAGSSAGSSSGGSAHSGGGSSSSSSGSSSSGHH